ncbi:hypothetical protein, partial [Paraburkholderia dipogonis]|uniref:hypothetical protein n=1 Tax=Paraburkholderia dipogonis TaxID=1211383 RepID=UPI0038BE064B
LLPIGIGHPKVGQQSLLLNLYVAGSLAECPDRRVHFDEDPLVQSATPVQGQPSVELETERFQPMCSARPGEGDRLRRVQKIFHEIKALAVGFEV